MAREDVSLCTLCPLWSMLLKERRQNSMPARQVGVPRGHVRVRLTTLRNRLQDAIGSTRRRPSAQVADDRGDPTCKQEPASPVVMLFKEHDQSCDTHNTTVDQLSTGGFTSRTWNARFETRQ